MLKVKVNCPVCGALILARSLDSHLERVHQLTGVVTLRVHPTRPYTHEPEAAPGGEAEPSEPTEPTGPAAETEPQEEKQQEPEGESEPEESEA